MTAKEVAKKAYKRNMRGRGNRNVKVLRTAKNKYTRSTVTMTKKTTIDGKQIYAVVVDVNGRRVFLETYTGYVAVLRAWDVFSKASGRKAA